MFRGRKILGDEILLGVQCKSAGTPTAPDAAPTMKIYTEAGAAVLSKAIPPLDRYSATGLFEYMQPLNSSFAAGRYFVRYTYVISGATKAAPIDSFEIVAGGSADGMYNALFYLDRPDGNDWVLGTTDQGTLTNNRGPHV